MASTIQRPTSSRSSNAKRKAVRQKVYVWKSNETVLDDTGRVRTRTKTGTIEAVSLNAARAKLRHSGIPFTVVKKETKSLFGGTIKEDQIVLFLRQFATMNAAGVPLIDSIRMLRDTTESKALAKMIDGMYGTLLEGEPLSAAFARYPKYFDPLTISLLRAGEQGGVLEAIMKRLADYREKSRVLHKKVRSALMYPAVTVFVMIVVVIIMMIKVIPVFAHLFTSFGAQLPYLTQVVVNLSYWMKNNVLVLIFAPILVVTSVIYARLHSAKARWVLDRLALRLPVFGPLLLKSAIARFFQTLATMQAAGVPLPDSMTTLSSISGNVLIDQSVVDARQSIMEGGRLSHGLKKRGIFPKMAIQMLDIGESTGSVDEMSSKIAEFYESEVRELVDRMSTLLEPFIMIFLGIVVGTLVVAMYLPMLTMGHAILNSTRTH